MANKKTQVSESAFEYLLCEVLDLKPSGEEGTDDGQVSLYSIHLTRPRMIFFLCAANDKQPPKTG